MALIWQPFIDKAVQGSPWGDGSQQAGSGAAIERFWCCIFVKILSFLWAVRGRWRSSGVPGASPGVSGTSLEGSRGVPGLPEAMPGVPGVHRGPQDPSGSGDVPGIHGILV